MRQFRLPTCFDKFECLLVIYGSILISNIEVEYFAILGEDESNKCFIISNKIIL
jgi:hypothetical protein